MNAPAARLDREGTIDRDHQQLRIQLSRLHEQLTLAALSASEADCELAHIQSSLETHFLHEEYGGFFTAVVDAAPEYSDRIRALRKQHELMRTLFAALRRTCRWACGESGSRAGWLAGFAEFHQLFDEHEAAEHDLLHEALQRDIGAGD